MTPIQCKMARSLTGLTVRELGERAEIAFTTINRFEKTGKASITTINKMQVIFEKLSVAFIASNAPSLEGGAGVRWVSAEAEEADKSK